MLEQKLNAAEHEVSMFREKLSTYEASARGPIAKVRVAKFLKYVGVAACVAPMMTSSRAHAEFVNQNSATSGDGTKTDESVLKLGADPLSLGL